MSEESRLYPEKPDKLKPTLFQMTPPKPSLTGVLRQLPYTIRMAQE